MGGGDQGTRHECLAGEEEVFDKLPDLADSKGQSNLLIWN